MWIRQGNYWLNLSHIRGLQVKGNAISAMPMDSMLFSSDLVDEFGDERKAGDCCRKNRKTIRQKAEI